MLIGRKWAKHQQLAKLRSVEELLEYIRRLQKEVARIVLTELESPESIIEVHPVSAWEKNDLINIGCLFPSLQGSVKERIGRSIGVGRKLPAIYSSWGCSGWGTGVISYCYCFCYQKAKDSCERDD